jgi:hypothetical protein
MREEGWRGGFGGLCIGGVYASRKGRVSTIDGDGMGSDGMKMG